MYAASRGARYACIEQPPPPSSHETASFTVTELWLHTTQTTTPYTTNYSYIQSHASTTNYSYIHYQLQPHPQPTTAPSTTNNSSIHYQLQLHPLPTIASYTTNYCSIHHQLLFHTLSTTAPYTTNISSKDNYNYTKDRMNTTKPLDHHPTLTRLLQHNYHHQTSTNTTHSPSITFTTTTTSNHRFLFPPILTQKIVRQCSGSCCVIEYNMECYSVKATYMCKRYTHTHTHTHVYIIRAS